MLAMHYYEDSGLIAARDGQRRRQPDGREFRRFKWAANREGKAGNTSMTKVHSSCT
jgi:hypothetical protein